jgi:hypothetical protein
LSTEKAIHNHGSAKTEIALHKKMNKMKSAIQENPHAAIRTVYEEVYSEVDPDIPEDSVPSYESVKSTLSRERGKAKQGLPFSHTPVIPAESRPSPRQPPKKKLKTAPKATVRDMSQPNFPVDLEPFAFGPTSYNVKEDFSNDHTGDSDDFTSLRFPPCNQCNGFSPFPHFATQAIHAGQEPEQWLTMDIVAPICPSTTYKQFAPGVHMVDISFLWFVCLFVCLLPVNNHVCYSCCSSAFV